MAVEKYVQEYDLHLMNDEVIVIREDYELEDAKSFVATFENASENDILEVYDFVNGTTYIPIKNICFYRTGDIKQTTAFSEKFERDYKLVKRSTRIKAELRV